MILYSNSFRNGCVEYMNCGHIPPLLISSTGSTSYLEEANLIVGIIDDAQYASSQFTLQPGDRILLTTDGITEIEDRSGQLIGIDGLAGLAHMCPVSMRSSNHLQQIPGRRSEAQGTTGPFSIFALRESSPDGGHPEGILHFSYLP